eukprot:TRINITY_DN8659_c0_g2_i1.p1 TRINITY_DN8659_c0_g2~~TRINITY_DN8659_c0_g2_i1.p1  ORF type:complete len:261 (-),score=44.50 TRINITY_DN8659_c0_g2_i1:1096-1878(-)
MARSGIVLGAVLATACLLVFSTLLLLKLESTFGLSKISWWWVFSPLFLFHVVTFRYKYSMPSLSPPNDRQGPSSLTRMVVLPVLVLEVILCCYLQLDGGHTFLERYGGNQTLLTAGQGVGGGQAVAADARGEQPAKKLIIAITPTYNRAAQAMHLVNVVNVLRIVPPPILWIVVDAVVQSAETAALLNATAGACLQTRSDSPCSSLPYVHMGSGQETDNPWQSRGVAQRNAALAYIESRRLEGIVYCMDDDNVYSPLVGH